MFYVFDCDTADYTVLVVFAYVDHARAYTRNTTNLYFVSKATCVAYELAGIERFEQQLLNGKGQQQPA